MSSAADPALRTGPLAGVRVVEVTTMGPVPFCGMVLADLGADVIVVDRASEVTGADPADFAGHLYGRGKRSIGLDLREPEGLDVLLRLADRADVLIEGFRPGVAERLGYGPEVCRERNPGLVYGRMTGWGQDGPMAQRAGHDINYIALAGPLAHIGRAGAPPTVPLNLLGDFAGGGMLLTMGIAAALFERSRSGEGQVIDAAMVDGTALLFAPLFTTWTTGFWNLERGTNFLDGGAPFYDCYACADGKWLAIGAIEPKFYAGLVEGLGLAGDESMPAQHDMARWPELRARITEVLATRTRDEWVAVFDPIDTCVTAVKGMDECGDDEHLRARGTYVHENGWLQPGPAPRFDRTPGAITTSTPAPGQHTAEILAELGLDPT